MTRDEYEAEFDRLNLAMRLALVGQDYKGVLHNAVTLAALARDNPAYWPPHNLSDRTELVERCNEVIAHAERALGIVKPVVQ